MRKVEVTEIRIRLLTTLILSLLGLAATGQSFLTKKSNLTFYPYTHIDTEFRYTDTTGISVIIQNSLPKGGGYTDSSGKEFGYRIFWTRIINETTRPMELTLHFPAHSSGSPTSSDPYLKIFLPSDTMTLGKETAYAYGATGLNSFLEANLNNPATLQMSIGPKQEYLFYTGALFTDSYAPARTKLIFKEQDLFYQISGITSLFDATLIPCGQIVFKN